jgi:ABC-type glycerol-3-phosphate transport system permease component
MVATTAGQTRRRPAGRRRDERSQLTSVLMHMTLVGGSLIAQFPIVWLLLSSFKPASVIQRLDESASNRWTGTVCQMEGATIVLDFGAVKPYSPEPEPGSLGRSGSRVVRPSTVNSLHLRTIRPGI